MILKSLEKPVKRLSEEIQGGLHFLNCEPREEMNRSNQPTGRVFYVVTLFCDAFKDNLDISLSEPIPKDIVPFSLVDIENCTVVYKGAYGGALPSGGHYGRLSLTVQNAERLIVLSSNVQANVNTQPKK